MYICVGKIDLSPSSNSHEVTAEKRIDAPKSRYGALNLLSYFKKKITIASNIKPIKPQTLHFLNLIPYSLHFKRVTE